VVVWNEMQVIAYGPADATATPLSLASLKSRMLFTFLVPAYPGCPGEEAVKWVVVWYVDLTIIILYVNII